MFFACFFLKIGLFFKIETFKKLFFRINFNVFFRMKRHATRMVFAVILTFGICWFPQNIRFFLRGLNYPNLSFWEYNTKFLITFQSTAQVLAYANSCTNPILYGVLSERFRNGLTITVQRLFCCVDKNLLLMKRRKSFSLATTIGKKNSYSTSKVTSPDDIRHHLKDVESSYSTLLQPPPTSTIQTTIYEDSTTNDKNQVLL